MTRRHGLTRGRGRRTNSIQRRGERVSLMMKTMTTMTTTTMMMMMMMNLSRIPMALTVVMALTVMMIYSIIVRPAEQEAC